MTLYYFLCMHLPAMHIVLTSIHSKLSCCSYSVENARYDWLFQLIAHSICAPFSCLTLNADTHLGCQHYTTFPRTAVSLSLFCYLFKIRIRRCVFISVGLLRSWWTMKQEMLYWFCKSIWPYEILHRWYNEILTTNSNKNHQSSAHNSCLCLMHLWTKCIFRFESVFAAIDDWMGMSFTESCTIT